MPLQINKTGLVTGATGGPLKQDFTDHLKSDKVATPAVGQVLVTSKNDGVESILSSGSETLSAPQISNKGEAFMITVGGGTTIPTEPYANVKVYISIQCPATQDSLEDVFQFASDWVSGKMEEAIKGVQQ